MKAKIIFYTILKKITRRRMIIDSTGILLTPGNGGLDCKGNGKNKNIFGKEIECCCDECDFLMCCIGKTKCESCNSSLCPRKK